MKLGPDALDKLAGEYVLGTLRGGARRRFEGWMRAQPALAARVAVWERRLVPMSAVLPPRPAPPGTFDAIERRLFGAPAPAAAPAPSRWPLKLAGAWAAFSTLALAAVVGVLVVAPERLVSPDTLAQRTGRVSAAYTAVLSPAEGPPALVASAARHSDQLDLKVLRAPPAPPPGTRHVLWAHAADGRRFALGVVDLRARARVTMAGTAEQLLSNVATLSVTAEPDGTLPAQPTQVAVLSGPCVKVW
jgi:anti-sigma-K factor RskA